MQAARATTAFLPSRQSRQPSPRQSCPPSPAGSSAVPARVVCQAVFGAPTIRVVHHSPGSSTTRFVLARVVLRQVLARPSESSTKPSSPDSPAVPARVARRLGQARVVHQVFCRVVRHARRSRQRPAVLPARQSRPRQSGLPSSARVVCRPQPA